MPAPDPVSKLIDQWSVMPTTVSYDTFGPIHRCQNNNPATKSVFSCRVHSLGPSSDCNSA